MPKAAWESTPQISFAEIKYYKCSNVVKEAISEKIKQRQIWIKTTAPQDKTKLNNANKYVKDLLEN